MQKHFFFLMFVFIFSITNFLEIQTVLYILLCVLFRFFPILYQNLFFVVLFHV